MSITTGQRAVASDFINKAQANVSPAADAGRVAKLEADGKIDPFFLRETSVFDDVTAIALSAGDPVGMNLEGKVAKAFRSWVAATGAQPSSFRLLEVDTNKFVVGWVTLPSLYTVNMAVGTYDPVTDTVIFDSGATNSLNFTSFDFCKVDTNKFVLMHSTDGTSDAFMCVGTVSGTSISFSGSTNFSAGSYNNFSCVQLDTNRFAFHCAANSGTGNFQGVATVSGTTISMLYTSTTVITNINTSSAAQIYRLGKLSTTKHVIVNGNNGYCVVIDSTSAYTAGTAFQPQGVTGASLAATAIVSDSATSFYVRVGGGMRRCTVSGTTITNNGNGVSISNDGGGDLCIYGGEIFEVHYNSTTAALTGIYKITHSTNLIRTQLCTLAMTGAAFIANIGSVFLAYQGSSSFFSSAMAANFVGFVKADFAQGATATVYPFGRVTGLSNLLQGVRYGALNGAWTPDMAGSYIAISSTELIVM
jgi:hypothetical protein